MRKSNQIKTIWLDKYIDFIEWNKHLEYDPTF